MDASKEIAEIIERVAIFTAIATFGGEWATASIAEIDDRAKEIGYRVEDVLEARKNERNLYT